MTQDQINEMFLDEYGDRMDAMTRDELIIAMYRHRERVLGHRRTVTDAEILAAIAVIEGRTDA